MTVVDKCEINSYSAKPKHCLFIGIPKDHMSARSVLLLQTPSTKPMGTVNTTTPTAKRMLILPPDLVVNPRSSIRE